MSEIAVAPARERSLRRVPRRLRAALTRRIRSPAERGDFEYAT